MDFHQLLAKMQELDKPAAPVVSAPVEECGEPMGMPPAPMSAEKDVPPPSMSVNLNAQGLDNIEQLMKLVTKVNPDMEKPAMPPMGAAPAIEIEPMDMPSITGPGPKIGSLGNLDAGPLKMLPDLDADDDAGHPEPDADNFGGPSDGDADNMPGGMDGVSKAQGDLDNDGDHDMDDHDMEKDKGDDDEKKDEEFANEPDEEYKSVDYMNNQLAGGMNKPKQTYGRVSPGDNPMAFRESIKQELLSRLAEAKSKGAK